MNAGSQNDFNKLETESGVWNFEPIFDDVDARLATLLRRIHQDRNLNSHDNRSGWADIVAVQLVRTPLVRTTLIQAAIDLATSISDALGTRVNIAAPTDNEARASAVRMFQDREDFRVALEKKDLVLFQAAGHGRFLISDCPVTRQSTVSYGAAGLSSPGIAVYLPLGPDLMLGLLCKSVKLKLNAQPIEQLSIPPDVAGRLIAIREGLRTGQPVPLKDESVAYFNDLQIAGCTRFLYGPEDSFDDVRETLQRHPKLRDVRSCITVGPMGSAPRPSQHMPEGRWLVLFGQTNHYMIEISDWSDEQMLFEACVSDVVTLHHALDDAPFYEMGLYVNKEQRLMMRDVRVDIIDTGPPMRIQFSHLDSAINQISALIRESR